MVWLWWCLEILSTPMLNYVLKIFLKYFLTTDSSMTALFYSFADRRSPSWYRPKKHRTSWQDLMRCDLQSESEQVRDNYEGWAQQAIRDDAMKKRKSPHSSSQKERYMRCHLQAHRGPATIIQNVKLPRHMAAGSMASNNFLMPQKRVH
jgi:uncharacterized protein YbcC (UPF0753/DUF2309 family)